MKKMVLHSFASAMVLAIAGFLATQAKVHAVGPTVLEFSEPDFEWMAGAGEATPYHLWTVGDYWRQSFVGTGLISASTLSLDLLIEDDSALASENLSFDVMLNGTTVGAFTLLANTPGLYEFDYNFAPIAGDAYMLEMVATSTISSGNGSFSLDVYNGVSSVTLIPEPTTLSLLTLGSLPLLLARKRRSEDLHHSI